MRLVITGQVAREAICQRVMDAPVGLEVMIQQPKRNLDQNAKLWACLEDVAKQVIWHGVSLTPDEFKDVFTAALRRAKVVPGLDGGFVVLGQRTSKMTKSEFSELIELILAFGAERNVKWSVDEDSTVT